MITATEIVSPPIKILSFSHSTACAIQEQDDSDPLNICHTIDIITDVQMSLLFTLLAGTVVHLSENCSNIYEDPTSFSFNIPPPKKIFNLYFLLLRQNAKKSKMQV